MHIAVFIILIYLVAIASAAIIIVKGYVSEISPAEKIDSDKTLLGLEIVIMVLAVVELVYFCVFVNVVEMLEWQQAMFVILGVVLCLGGALISLKIEQIAGYYVCKKCGHAYVPKYTDVLTAAHVMRSKYMKCQNCKRRAWHKKIVTKL